MKIAVLGAGNGAQSVSADLSLRGHEVNIFNRTKEKIEPIIQSKGIEIVGDIIQGFAKINLATDNIREAIKKVDLIVIIVPSMAHSYMAQMCGPYLEDGQIIFINPGHTGGGLEFFMALKKLGIKKDVKICESASLTFICRIVGPAKVRITYRFKNLLFSALPALYTSELHDLIKSEFPGIIPAKNVLETGLNNYNAVLHPPGMLMNAGWIEFTKGNFKFYYEGITPSVGRVIEALDHERASIAKKFGFKPHSYTDQAYESGLSSVKSESVCETVHAEEANKFVKTGESLKDRYVEEDVGYGLVPMAQIANIVNVPTPTMDSLIQLANIANQIDYHKTGRNLEKMGLNRLKNVGELTEFVNLIKII